MTVTTEHWYTSAAPARLDCVEPGEWLEAIVAAGCDYIQRYQTWLSTPRKYDGGWAGGGQRFSQD